MYVHKLAVIPLILIQLKGNKSNPEWQWIFIIPWKEFRCLAKFKFRATKTLTLPPNKKHGSITQYFEIDCIESHVVNSYDTIFFLPKARSHFIEILCVNSVFLYCCWDVWSRAHTIVIFKQSSFLFVNAENPHD